jgi:hypothetical protein
VGKKQMPIYRNIARVLTVALIAVGLCFSSSDAVYARTPMRIGGGTYFLSRLGKFCFQSEIFVAQIMSASPADCRSEAPHLPTCNSKDDLTFRLRVDEMLGANEQELTKLRVELVQPGESIDVVTRLFNSRPTDPEGQFPPEDEFGILKVDPPTGAPLSDQEISRLFIGQRFIFGIRPNPFDKTHLPSATVWTMKMREWVEDNLRQPLGSCSKTVHLKSP